MKRGIKGITIIALIVSVVIILILGTVTLNMAFGEEGFLQQSKDMQKKREREASREEDDLNEMIEYFDEVKEKNSENDAGILKKVAQIGSKRYFTLQEAINDVEADNTRETIKLLADTTETITIAENQNILLDLNDHTLISNPDDSGTSGIDGTIRNQGTLTVNNGNVIQEGNNGFTTINNQGTLEIGSTAKIINNCRGDFSIAIRNGGNVKITGGTVSAVVGILNFWIVEISGKATISGEGEAIRNNGGTVSIGEEVTIIGSTTGI